MTSRDFFPSHAFRFKGGAAAAPTIYQPPSPAVTNVAAPAPPAPPATTTAPEVTQARMDAKRQASKRKGLTSTILAGTGSGESANALGGGSAPAAGKSTLLGGG